MNKIQSCIITGIIMLGLFSCGKKDQIGPDINGMYGPLNVTTTLNKSADNLQFANGETVFFTAAFEKQTVWTLTLKGQTSGAVKTFNGITTELTAANTLWNGSADKLPSFSAEVVDVILTFPNSVNDTLKTTITIVSARNADADAVLISNFNTTKVTGAGSTTGWPSDWQATDNLHTAYGFPDGTRYLRMLGHPWNGTTGPGTLATTPYIDFITFKANEADTPYGTYYPLYADPTRVYFNFMMYNTGSQNFWIKIIFYEDGEAARSIDIKKDPTWIGWNLLSFNYTEAVAADTKYTVPQPSKITAVQFVLLNSKTGTSWPQTNIDFCFDHPVFTHDRPYQP